MTPLQKKELEILKCFIEVCDKLNITYYLVCGTALGAVKYRGFIPWDDDIDVALPRTDYERFLKEAPGLLPEWLFLQNYKTDVAFPQIFSKLRDSRTTYIEKSVSHLPINHGVYIDIFPLDGYPNKKIEQYILELKKKGYVIKFATAFSGKRSFKLNIACRIYKLLGYQKKMHKVAAKYDRLISKYSILDSAIWCNHGNWQGKLEYAPKEQYGKGAIVKFEGLDVRVPEQYDAYLRQKYGDYTKDPPIEEQIGHHYYTVLDIDKSYTEYVQK